MCACECVKIVCVCLVEQEQMGPLFRQGAERVGEGVSVLVLLFDDAETMLICFTAE